MISTSITQRTERQYPLFSTLHFLACFLLPNSMVPCTFLRLGRMLRRLRWELMKRWVVGCLAAWLPGCSELRFPPLHCSGTELSMAVEEGAVFLTQVSRDTIWILSHSLIQVSYGHYLFIYFHLRKRRWERLADLWMLWGMYCNCDRCISGNSALNICIYGSVSPIFTIVLLEICACFAFFFLCWILKKNAFFRQRSCCLFFS